MRCALYARYSTDYQNPLSVQDQLFTCKRWVESQGGVVVGEYYDEAVTGAFDNRPGFQNLIEDSKTKSFDVIVAEGLERLSRDQADIALFFRNITSRDMKIFTIQEGYVDMMTVAFKGTMNAMFRSDLAIKVRRGQEACIRAGKFVGNAPYGYEYLREVMGNKLLNQGLRVIDAEAAIVRRIFQEYADGSSPRDIAKRLNEQGFKRDKGKSWNGEVIRGNGSPGNGILFNKIYIGTVQWGKRRVKWDYEGKRRLSVGNDQKNWTTVPAEHLRIIDDQLWARVQSKRAEISEVRPSREYKNKGDELGSRRRPKYLTTGKIECGKCGGGMAIGSNRIRCSSWRNGSGCNNSLTADSRKIDARILGFLKSQLLTSERLEQFLSAYRQEMEVKAKEIALQKDQNVRELEKLIRQRDNIITRVAEGLKSKSLLDRLQEIELEIARLDKPGCPLPKIEITDEQLIERYAQAVENLEDCVANGDTKQSALSLIRPLIEKIVMWPNGKGYKCEIFGNLAALTGVGTNASSLIVEAIL